MNKVVVFAGTFDPFTKGHYDIVKRASEAFDEVVVAVAGDGTEKKCVATLNQRLAIVQASVEDLTNVRAEVFNGLLTDWARKKGIKVFVRGIRNTVDFEYEKNLYATYKALDSEVEVVYFISNDSLSFVSSSFVKELIGLKGDASEYICSSANKLVKDIY